MRKILSLVLALSMVLGMFSFAFAASLSDIEGEYYEAAVEALVELGVVNGYGDGTFKPNNVVSRAEMAKMLVIALGHGQTARSSTQFSDVAADHWASGFINVAAQFKVIVGYPDGTFKPDAEVTYAEAVTMVLRALGYKNVVEVSGTWPTNYITKANELQLLDGMKFDGLDVGAKRGNVAILLWNMLRTEMWAIQSENQTNGMTYGKTTGEPMLNSKFPDYKYVEDARVTDINVEDGEVSIELKYENSDGNYEWLSGELLKGDILKLYGRTVTALYNKEEKAFLVVTPTDADSIVEGKTVSLEEEKIKVGSKSYKYSDDMYDLMQFNNALADYVLLVLDGGKVIAESNYVANSQYVEKVKSVDDEVRINGSKIVLDEDSLIIIDGEKVDATDIKEGDVVTEFKLYLDKEKRGTFYVVTRDTVDGDLEKYVVGSDTVANSDVVTLDGEKYYVAATAVLYEEDEDKQTIADIDDTDYLKALKGKEATLSLDCFGEIVRINVDEVNPDAASTGIYLAVSEGEDGTAIWHTADEDGTVYNIRLMDENGKKTTYAINTKEVDVDLVAVKQGDLVYAKFDSKDRVKFLEVITDGWDNGEASAEKLLEACEVEDAELDGKKIAGMKVDDGVVVFSVYTTENDDDEEELVMNVESGRSELKGLDGEDILVITGRYDVVKYVVLGGELGQKDLLFGTVENVTKDIEENVFDRLAVVFDGKGDEIVVAEESEEVLEGVKAKGEDGIIVAYKLNGKDELVVKTIIFPSEIAGNDTEAGHGYVESTTGKDAEVNIGGVINSIHLDDEDFVVPGTGKKITKFKFMLVEVDETSDGYEFSDYEEVDLEDLTFKKNDRISIGKGDLADYIFVIRGMDARGEV